MASFLPGGPDPDPDRQRKFEALAAGMIGTGGKSVEVRFGAATLTFTASATASVSVTHGLGRTPASITLGVVDVNASIIGTASAVTSTTLTIAGRQYKDVAITGSVTVYWVAIG